MAPEAGFLLALAVCFGGKVGEEGVKTEAALESALALIDLWIHGDDGLVEGRLAFDDLCLRSRLFDTQGAVLHGEIQFLQIRPGNGMPKSLPLRWSDGDGLHVHPLLGGGVGLIPKTDDEDERLFLRARIELAQGIAQANGRAEFDGFGVNWKLAMMRVRTGWNVPFLGVLWGAVAFKKSVAQPVLEPQAMTLHLASGGGGGCKD